MRKLGIDFGTKKVGLALTDEAGKLAFPHDVVPNNSDLLTTVVDLLAEKQVDTIIIGHSLAHDGTPNLVQADIEAFIADLTLRVLVPIHLEPEQLTTTQAALLTGKNDRTDAAAAALILDTWLQKQATNQTHQVNQVSTDKHSTEPEINVSKSPEPVSPVIDFEQFMAVDIRLGTIMAIEVVEKADKLLQLTVDVGDPKPRTILSGIREYVTDEQSLVGTQCPFVVNLAPRTICGIESQGMILAASTDDTFVFMRPSTPLPPGTRLV